MYNDEQRVLELTRTLEDLVECFNDAGDSWTILGMDNGFHQVHPDIEPFLERAIAVLYNEDSPEDEDDDDSLWEE